MEASGSEVRFDGRVAIVTGAGGGLGRAHARLLARRGARVVVNDVGRDTHGLGAATDAAAAVVAEIRAEGGDAVANTDDVLSAAGGASIVRCATETYGRVDIVVNNAGISGGGSTFDRLPAEDIERMIATHLTGAFHVTQPAWAVMREQRHGRIVMTSSNSTAGLGSHHYGAAKAGLVGLTRNLAVEGRAHGILVNAIWPVAWSRLTAQIPDAEFRAWLEQHFSPEKVSPLVAWLCHDDASCSGETFTVGGGRIARIVLSVGDGIVDPDLEVETVRDRFAEILEDRHLTEIATGFDEVARYRALIPDPATSAASGDGGRDDPAR